LVRDDGYQSAVATIASGFRNVRPVVEHVCAP
jgi:hypothetical protein